MKPSPLSIPVAVACLCLQGCTSLPEPRLPAQVPAHWHADAGLPDAETPDPASWWTALGDPALDPLVHMAMRQNLGLAQARSRLRQARQLARGDRSPYLPTVSGVTATVQDAAAVDSYFHVGLDATWELGLFGAGAAVDRIGQARIDTAVVDERAVRVSTVAEVVLRWLEWRVARGDALLLEQMLALDDRALALHAARQRLSLGAMDDRAAVELRRARVDAQLATSRLAAGQARQALAVLLGLTDPSEVPLADPGPGDTSAMAPTRLRQVPADLLRLRPDIQAAEVEVSRAGGELGLANAQLYPRVVLGASFITSFDVTRNRRGGSNSLLGFGPMIDVPLFDWGRRRAAVDAQSEALQAALLGYRQAVVQAMGEVESALIALEQSGRRTEAVEAGRQAMARGAARQAVRQRLGFSSGLDQLEAERSGLQARIELGDSRLAQMQAFVGLYKALGGASAVPPSADDVGLTP